MWVRHPLWLAYLVPRHQLPPGLLYGQAAVTTLSYLPVPSVLGGQTGHPEHAEGVQPLLQLVGLGDFLGEGRRGSVLSPNGQPSTLQEGSVCGVGSGKQD